MMRNNAKASFMKLCGYVAFLIFITVFKAGSSDTFWKADVAKADITPSESLWMAGYEGGAMIPYRQPAFRWGDNIEDLLGASADSWSRFAPYAINRVSLRFLADKTFGKANQLAFGAIGLPDNTPVLQNFENDTARCASHGFYSIADFPIGSFAERFDDLNHGISIQNTSYVVGDSGSDLTPAALRQVRKCCGRKLAPDIGEGIAVEEKERGFAVTGAKEFYRLLERDDLLLFFAPFSRCRFLSLSIKAVLRASS
jgi:hypothetical protein